MKNRKLKLALVGFFGAIVLFASYWGLNYLKGTNFFKSTNTFYVTYSRVDGLLSSAPVTVNGFKVGQVLNIELLPGAEGNLKVTLIVSDEINIPKNSIARIYSMDLMGSKGIELVFEDTNELHKSEDFLIGDIEKSLKDEVNFQMLPLKTQAEDLMAEIQSAIEIVRYIFNEKTQANLEQSFESIQKTFQHLESSAYGLDTLLIAQSKRINAIMINVSSITENLARNNQQITNILNNLSQITDSITKADFVKTVENANNAIASFDSIINHINSGQGTLGELIHNDDLYYSLDGAASSLDKLLTDLRLNPTKYVSFSLMNFGRTINVNNEDELSNKDKRRLEKQREKEEKTRQKNLEKEQQNSENNDEANLYFMIQIKSGSNKIENYSKYFNNYTNIVELENDGWYRYFTAIHFDENETSNLLKIIKKDFPDAFPVAFYENNLITYTQGKELLYAN